LSTDTHKTHGAGAGSFDTLRKCVALLPARMRWRWAVLTPMVFLTGLVEGGAAAAVFGLIKAVSDPSRISHIRVLSAIVGALPWRTRGAQVIELVALVALYYVFKNLLVIAMHYLRHEIVGQSIAAVRGRMLSGYLAMPYPFHALRNSADLIWNTNEGVETMYGVAMSAAVAGASEMLTAASIAVVLLLAAPKVTLVAGAVLLGMFTALLRLTRRIARRYGTRRRELERGVLRTLQEVLGGVKEIKVLGRERFFTSIFEEQQAGVLKLGYLAKTMETAGPYLTETVFVCAALLVIAMVMGGGRAGVESLPILALFSYAAFRIVPSVNRITWRVNQIRAAGPAAESLYEDYQRLAVLADSAAATSSGDGHATTFNERIDIEHVSYAYPGSARQALSDVTLTIRCGESIGIVGPTGSGKSTLIDLIVGLLEPSSGRLMVDGKELARDPSQWKRSIGYVPQSIFLVDTSLRRNVALGIPDAEIDEQRVSRAIRIAGLEQFVATLPEGLDTTVGERGVRLSGGQRQRIGIARALYHDPVLLVFDEATSALDNVSEAELLKEIRSFESRFTMLIVAHRLSTVRDCDRLVFVCDGRLGGSGSYEALLRDSAEFRHLVTSGQIRPDPLAD
jgi:ATP-binding cassette subfamily C protein